MKSHCKLKLRGLALATIIAFSLPLGAWAGQFGFTVDQHDLTSDEIRATEILTSAVEVLLPQKMKDGIGRKLRLSFTSFGENLSELPDISFQLGRESGNGNIEINRLLLPEVLKGPLNSKKLHFSHKNYFDQAVGALIHEVSHVYDVANIQPADVREMIEECQQYPESAMSAMCRAYLRRKRTISADPYYLDLAGWVDTGFAFITRSLTNQATTRSPDPYEFENPEEHFAVNMEFFLLDPEYACRRPGLFRYFARHFGMDPFPSRNCRTSEKLFVYSSTSQGPGQSLVEVPLDRLYEVQFLLAGKGEEAISKWGHAMFRLVLCAPERKSVGPECLKDLQHHLVVSFRAAPADLVTDPMKGMFGEYPTRMFILPLLEVIDEYTSMELRELKGLTLRFSPEQKELFLRRVVEMELAYQGKYYFLSNNCGTEALNLLRAAVDSDELRAIQPRTPLGLYQDLIDQGLGTVPSEGSYFASQKPTLDSAFERIRPYLELRPKQGLEDYFNSTNAKKRLELFEAGMAKLPVGSKPAYAAGFYILETHLAKRLAADIDNRALNLAFFDNSSNGQSVELKKLFEEYQAAVTRAQPLSEIGGYGIPLDGDYPVQAGANVNAQRTSEFSDLFNRIRSLLGNEMSDSLQELEQTRKNRKIFADVLSP